MKRQYDYFDKFGGIVRLYRVPRGEAGPVEYSSTSGNGWFGSQYTSRTDMQNSSCDFQSIDAKRAREICNGNEVEVTGPEYFWWQTASDVSPYLVRINPDNSVDSYIEPEHRASTYWAPVIRSNGWASGVYTASEIRINSHVTPISEAEARQRRPFAFESPSTVKWDGKKFDGKILCGDPTICREDYEYYHDPVGGDVYRRKLSKPDIFQYWSNLSNGWFEPTTSASNILQRCHPISADWAKSIMPRATIEESSFSDLDVEPVDKATFTVLLQEGNFMRLQFGSWQVEITVSKLP